MERRCGGQRFKSHPVHFSGRSAPSNCVRRTLQERSNTHLPDALHVRDVVPVPWSLKGRMVESCSCHVMYPCWLPLEGVKMDRGWCDSVFLFRIDEGKSNRVDISGRTVALAMDFPGPNLSNGNGTARLYIDDGATKAQHTELEAIFQGKRGGGMQGLGSPVARWLPTRSTAISVQETKGQLTSTVGPFGGVRSRRLRNAAGKVVRLHNVTLLGATPIDLAPSGSEWHDPDMPRSFRTESGGVGRISWKG